MTFDQTKEKPLSQNNNHPFIFCRHHPQSTIYARYYTNHNEVMQFQKHCTISVELISSLFQRNPTLNLNLIITFQSPLNTILAEIYLCFRHSIVFFKNRKYAREYSPLLRNQLQLLSIGYFLLAFPVLEILSKNHQTLLGYHIDFLNGKAKAWVKYLSNYWCYQDSSDA